jgi:hypothetical protein
VKARIDGWQATDSNDHDEERHFPEHLWTETSPSSVAVM